MSDHERPDDADLPGAPGNGSPDDPLRAVFDGPSWNAGSRRRHTSPQQRVRRRRKRRVRRVRRWTLGLVGIVLLAGAVWIVVTGLLARSELNQARGELTAVRAAVVAGDAGRARGQLATLTAHARRAHTLTTGPAWWVAASIPWAGDPLRSVRGVAAAVDELGRSAVTPLVDSAGSLTPSKLRRGATVDLAALTSAQPAVHAAAQAFAHVSSQLSSLPSSTWLGAVDSARDSAASEVGSAAASLHSADAALQVMPTLLGGDRPRRYFVAFQNEAELRGTGGLVGAFAVVRADHGTITFERFESDSFLGRVSARVDFGPEYDKQYGPDTPYDQIGDANESPHWPYAAQILASMWQTKTGEALDGAIGIDATALSYALGATGPATLADGSQVTADNIVALTQQGAYAKFPTAAVKPARDAYVISIAKAVEQRLLSGSGSAAALVRAFSHAADERRLLVYSTDPATQAVLAAHEVGGTIPQTAAPFAGFSINNARGNKLDYYLLRQMTYTATGCTGTRTVTATLQLTNTAPASGLPTYVTSRNDKNPYAIKPGDNLSTVSFIATAGAQLRGATLDGKTIGVNEQSDLGHPAYRISIELPVGATRTFTVTTVEPASSTPVTILAQPGVNPLQQSVHEPSCS